MPSSLAISWSWPATSICSCSLSTTQGPAMRKKGLSRPTSNPQSFIYEGDWAPVFAGVTARPSGLAAADDLERRLRDALLVLLQRRPDEGREERVAVARCGGELGVVLAAEVPRVIGELGHLGQVLGVGLGGDLEPGRFEPRHVVVVGLVAVAMALGHRVLAVDPVRERALLHRAGLRAQAHGAAEVGVGVALLHLAVVVLPLGDQRDHRMRGLGIELGRVGPLEPDLVARELDRSDLHAEADAEIGDLRLARVLYRRDLALDAALAEAAGH